MTMAQKTCERHGCTEDVSYNPEARPEVVPDFCSFDCRDRVEDFRIVNGARVKV